MPLRVVNLKKHFGRVKAVQDISLRVSDGELLVLLGPSGCGKTTTLRMIAGLEEPSSGEVFIGGREVSHNAPNERDVAFVFQQPAFLPNRTVAQNIAYPLICRSGSWLGLLRKKLKENDRKTVERLGGRLGITHLLDRYPSSLSGGELQRVSLARALAKEAHILLLDEPLANVDVQLRESLRRDFLRLKEVSFGDTSPCIIYVTHDQEDAMMIGDQVALMKDGHILQIGTPSELYADPVNLFTAQFIGTPRINTVSGVLEEFGPEQVSVRMLSRVVELNASKARRPRQTMKQHAVLVAIRPSAIHFQQDGMFSGSIRQMRDFGEHHRIVLEVEGMELTAVTTEITGCAEGNATQFDIDLVRLMVFDPNSGERLF